MQILYFLAVKVTIHNNICGSTLAIVLWSPTPWKVCRAKDFRKFDDRGQIFRKCVRNPAKQVQMTHLGPCVL